MLKNVTGQMCRAPYFNSEFNRFASLVPANATSFFASAFAAFSYLLLIVNGPAPSPIGER